MGVSDGVEDVDISLHLLVAITEESLNLLPKLDFSEQLELVKVHKRGCLFYKSLLQS